MIALKAKYLLDGIGSKPIKDPVVIIDNGKITEVNSGSSGNIPQGSETLDFSDGTIMPGMINLHAHLTATPGLLHERHNESHNILTLKAERHAKIALRSGVTTIRDCGGPDNVTVDLKRAMEAGIWSGPRLVVCGRVLTTTGGHGRDMGITCDGPHNARKAVRHLVKNQGVDFIKVMATGGSTLGTDATYPSFTVEELAAITDEAHNLEKRVVAHAGGRQGVLNAVEAGVDDIAHVGMKHPDNRDGKYHPDVGKRIAETQTFVHFTMRATFTRLAYLEEDSEDYRSKKAYVENKMETLGHLQKLGVKIGAGDDGGWSYVTWDGFAQELELMTRGGMTPIEAITAATGTAAEAIGMKDQLGAIEPGKSADVLVVRGEPFTDLEHLRNVRMVIKEGSIVHETQ
ncbi:MAG: amidohydrolase family protein [Candidatus Thorarchaeota archaeon]|jgi:imidazolonepropionase-like amidohydrolase